MTRRRTLLADLFAAGTLLAAPLLFVALTPEDAHAAEFTDLLDAADLRARFAPPPEQLSLF